ncbi:hypothetical protein HPB48_016222 [Haemaphysalis longicornis]|uniref:Uncharacterized protein n=1 Tax=Haemaphysalis longicornis TaxID=44386 RepID=A0A9J6GUC0_HAELO|nr:hypothetical protein HPB48_016222 [Haemaphysalis longicornis]
MEKGVPIVGAALSQKAPGTDAGLPIVEGLIGGERVRVLRDTGCNTAIVKRCLVRDRDLTGTSSPVCLLDRSVLMLPEASIVVDTPYFTGRLRVKCLDSPLYDLVLGNVEGVRPGSTVRTPTGGREPALSDNRRQSRGVGGKKLSKRAWVRVCRIA